MAIRSFLSSTILVGMAMVSLTACGQEQAGKGAAAPAETPAPEISIADALSPQDLILRGLECRSSLLRARAVAERLPADAAQTLAAAPDISFLGLIKRGTALDLSAQTQQTATNAFRHAPAASEHVTEDYIQYIEDCAAIATRAATVLATEPS